MSRATGRKAQLAYSQIQDKTHDTERRQRKAEKIIRVLQHFLGREDLSGLLSVDIGCSTGFTSKALSDAGCRSVGLDIDLPGLAHARAAFGADASFLGAEGAALPFATGSVDIVVFNHIYEHVVDPDAVLAEIRRVLKPDGVAYLGFGNRLQIIEPHYRLPLLSWLPPAAADRYVRRAGAADEYYERFRTRPALKRMCGPLRLWDYTYTVLADAEAFRATDVVPEFLRNLPPGLWRTLAPVVPTYIWVGTPGELSPQGPRTVTAPRLLRSQT